MVQVPTQRVVVNDIVTRVVPVGAKIFAKEVVTEVEVIKVGYVEKLVVKEVKVETYVIRLSQFPQPARRAQTSATSPGY